MNNNKYNHIWMKYLQKAYFIFHILTLKRHWKMKWRRNRVSHFVDISTADHVDTTSSFNSRHWLHTNCQPHVNTANNNNPPPHSISALTEKTDTSICPHPRCANIIKDRAYPYQAARWIQNCPIKPLQNKQRTSQSPLFKGDPYTPL